MPPTKPEPPRQALILAGGAGTRLRSVVSEMPKPMAPVADRPFLEYVVAQVVAAGVPEIVLLVGYLAQSIERHFGAGERFGAHITYSCDIEPLGTGGALKHAEPLLEGDRWLVLNGDSLFDISLAELVARHLRHPAPATLAVARVADQTRYGSVTLAADGRVTAFAEKSGQTTPNHINGGLYMIERSALQRIPVDRPVSFEREVLPGLVGHGLRGEPFDGYFVDIGVPADYAKAQLDRAVFDRLISASR